MANLGRLLSVAADGIIANSFMDDGKYATGRVTNVPDGWAAEKAIDLGSGATTDVTTINRVKRNPSASNFFNKMPFGGVALNVLDLAADAGAKLFAHKNIGSSVVSDWAHGTKDIIKTKKVNNFSDYVKAKKGVQ